MGRVTVLTTGGTIASRQSSAGGATAADDVAQLLAQIEVPAAVTVEGREILRVNSFAMTPADMRTVLTGIEEALADPEVDGVVVTHGTDTMEETALLVDLFVGDDRPVVFTGAQRAADQAEADGPANVRDAIIVAAAPQARGLGVLIVFDGAVYPARGTRKTQTVALAAFDNPERGALGHVDSGQLSVTYRPVRSTPLASITPASITPASAALADELPRVDIVALYPGVDAVAMFALAQAGSRGLVLEATGIGNANPVVVEAVRELVAAGVSVLVSTRVDEGPVAAIYGGGGGVDLVAAGAVLTGQLRPGQARILLIALLATGASGKHIHLAFTPQATDSSWARSQLRARSTPAADGRGTITNERHTHE